MKKSKPTPAQITAAKNALYKACVDAIENYDVDDAYDLEQELKDSSDDWSAALEMVWKLEGGRQDKTKPVKAFTLNRVDFNKVKEEVEDSCLSDEGKKAILKAMGVED